MNEDISLDSVDFSLIDNVKSYIASKVSSISDEAPNEEIKNIIIKFFDISEDNKKLFKAFEFGEMNFSSDISTFITSIKASCKKSINQSTITNAFVKDKKVINDFCKGPEKNSVPNFILKIIEIILKSGIKKNQNTALLESTETTPNDLDEENKRRVVNLITVRNDILDGLDEIKKLAGPDSHNFTIKILIIACGFVILIALFGFYFQSKKDTEFFISTMNGGKSNGDESKESQGHNKGDIGILKKQINELFNPVLKELVDINKIITDSSKDLSKSLSKKLDDKIDEIKQAPMVEIKLDGVVIKKVFDSVIKDEKSEFGKAILKINGIGDKKPVDTVDTTSDKNKKELVDLVKNKDRLEKENKGLSDKILEVSTSVSNLKDEVKNKNKEIGILEAKIKSIGDEKTGFKGPAGSYAILLTNSADFQLPSSLLETVFGVLEKQNGISKDVQKIGMYIATGEDISSRYDLRTKIKPKNPTATEPLTGRPTECIIEVGKSFLKYAFDNGKEPAIPIADRKAIIIATLSAKAPKLDSDGWDKITQVDAILIQTPKDKDFREASDWLDFTHKKNGRLVFVQGFDKFAAGSPSLLQLEKHLLTLLNTKKE